MSYGIGPIEAQGAFTADFGLPAEVPLAQVPALIERDRAIMATRPGMRQKHLPAVFDESSGRFLSGGRYLFDTFENALAYRDWVEHGFVLDGTKFFERPYFIDPIFFAWHVIGAHDFKPIAESHKVIRFERWSGSGDARAALERAWPDLRDEAQSRGLASAWLLYNPEHQQIGVISVADVVGSSGPADPDAMSLRALESAPSLGFAFQEQRSSAKAFDRTSWVLTIWFPLRPGEPVEPALWPNSPPLPAPVPSAV
jgi:hypothetical protein